MRTYLPSGPDQDVPAGWGVRRAARLAFPGAAAVAADPVHSGRLRTYLTDMLRPYELALDEAAFARGGQSYGEMAEALIRAAVPPGESVDLLVLAYSVPDVTPGRATATWLSHVCPGGPLAFAVSDETHTAAFTALRLARAYAAGAGPARALLLVVEQPVLPYPPGAAVLPSGAYGVGLLLGPTGLAGPDGEAPGDVTAILGQGLAGGLPDELPGELAGIRRVRTAEPGRPGTGVWWELAGEVERAAPGRARAGDGTPEPRVLVGADRTGARTGPPAAMRTQPPPDGRPVARRFVLADRAAGGGLALATVDAAAGSISGSGSGGRR
jgi:4-hydroxymandelate oxidase